MSFQTRSIFEPFAAHYTNVSMVVKMFLLVLFQLLLGVCIEAAFVITAVVSYAIVFLQVQGKIPLSSEPLSAVGLHAPVRRVLTMQYLMCVKFTFKLAHMVTLVTLIFRYVVCIHVSC